MPSFWQLLLLRWLAGRTYPGLCPRSAGRRRLGLESLEDRCTPSTLTVTNLLDHGDGSLRDQIAAAAAGDTITFAVVGTILLTTGELDIAQNLTIQGPGANNVTISGGNTQRVFHVEPDAAVTISGLTIANGHVADVGGGIDSEGSLSLLNSILSNNSAGAGGGGVAFVVNHAAALTVSGTTFTNNRGSDGAGLYSNVTSRSGQIIVMVTNSNFTSNTATGLGGGLDMLTSLSGTAGGTVSVTGGQFTNNRAATGGAIATSLHTADNSQGTTTVSGVVTTANNAAQNGGGIDAEVTSADSSQATAILTGDVIASNTATVFGGGVYDVVTSVDSGHASLTFVGSPSAGVNNNTAGNGAGIFSSVITMGSGSATAAFNATNVFANMASQSGGGLYSLVSNSGSGTAAVTLSDGTVVDNRAGASQGGGVFSSVRVNGAGSAGATVTGLTVTGNVSGTDGGGVYAMVANTGGGTHLAAASTTVTSSTMSHNASGDGPNGGGGGLFLSVTSQDTGTATASLSGDSITGNTARGAGGGINTSVFSRGSGPASVALSSTTVSGNSSGTNGGGGIFSFVTATNPGPATLAVTNSVISGNTAGSQGGGLGAAISATGTNTSASVTLTGSTVSGNRGGAGGGLFFNLGTVAAGETAQALVTACTISGNSSSSAGGGILGEELNSAGSATTLTVTNSTLYANRAVDGGGLSNSARGPVGAVTGATLVSDTVAFNAATSGGGLEAITVVSGSFTVRSTIVAANTAGSGADAMGTFLSGGHNLIGQTNGSSGWLASDLKGTSANPLDARFGDFGTFGGPTRTLAVLGDSPTIGHGDPAGPTTDQRGVARSPTAPTIGAYELGKPGSFQVVPAFSSVQAGIAFSVSVNVLDSSGSVLTGYTGTIHFASSDADAVLPADYTFTLADAGRHTFTGGVTFSNEGNQTLTVSGDGATGTTTVKVTELASFEVVPDSTGVPAGSPLTVTVRALDPDGNVLPSYSGTIQFSSSDPDAVLPADYTFTAADAGRHTFTQAVTFQTEGDQTLTVTGDGITATTTITVTGPVGTLTPLPNLAPANIGTMLLLPDGTVLAQGALGTPTWYRLTPDATGSYLTGTWAPLASSHLARLYYASNVLPDGRVFVLGGEYTGPNLDHNNTNTGEIYDPVANTWTAIQNFPQAVFGDDPSALLPDGRILAGYIIGPQTYIYDPASNTWSLAANKLRNERSDEESWVTLPDGSVLSYDVFNNGHAQRYIPSQNQWVDAGTVPVFLTNGSAELGPGVRVPDGRIWFLGATGHTAFYDPSADAWTAGPDIPDGLVADDNPAAVMPNGHVLFTADHSNYTGPTTLFDFDPVTGSMTRVMGGTFTDGAFVDRMLMLPNGQVLLTTGGKQLFVYTPHGEADPSWRPAIAGVTDNGDGTFTLTGTQLNGISEGAAYGDDAEMSSNYPIIRLVDADGNVFYARTFGWGVGVATGDTPVSTNFTLPDGIPAGTYSLSVVANGIASDPVDFTVSSGEGMSPRGPAVQAAKVGQSFRDMAVIAVQGQHGGQAAAATDRTLTDPAAGLAIRSADWVFAEAAVLGFGDSGYRVAAQPAATPDGLGMTGPGLPTSLLDGEMTVDSLDLGL